MYTVSIWKEFTAYHFLVGGDWGRENRKHSHLYGIKVELAGNSLDAHGYLVDIVEAEQHLEAVISMYREKTLNELEEFEGLNPSIEHFSRIICQGLLKRLRAANLSGVTVTVREDQIASASYRQEL